MAHRPTGGVRRSHPDRLANCHSGVSITGEAGRIADNRIEHNTFDGISNDYGLPVLIMRNVVTANGGEGVRVHYIAHATVLNNRISDNGLNGVAVYGSGGEFGDTHATVEDNRVERNSRDGGAVPGRQL